MFRFVSRKLILLHTKCSTNCPREIAATYAFLVRYPFARSVSNCPSSKSNNSPVPLTASHLTEACGLPPKAAATVVEKLHLQTADKPQLVLRMLKDYGLSPSQIAGLVVKYPRVLTFNATKTLKPKLDYFRSAGFDAHLGDLLLMNCRILSWNLERRMIPCFEFLFSVLKDKELVIQALQWCNQALSVKQAPNIEILRSHGISEAVILRLLNTRASALMRSPERFARVVQKVKDMGVPCGSSLFAYAVGIMAYHSESAWEEKVRALRSFGWSDAHITSAFRKQPMFMCSSLDLTTRKLKLLSETFGWDSAFLSARPRLIAVSMRKLVLRSNILSMLLSRGLLEMGDGIAVASLLRAPDDDFAYHVVSKYADQMPEIVEAYEAKLQS